MTYLDPDDPDDDGDMGHDGEPIYDLARLLSTLEQPEPEAAADDPLADLAQVATDYRARVGDLAEAITAAHRAGATVSAISRASGFTRQAITYRLRKDAHGHR